MRRLLITLALLAPATIAAQGRLVPRGCLPPAPMPRPDRPRPVPMPCIAPEGGIVRTASNVKVTLDGRVLRYEVEERFRNTGGRVDEADYLFPLPKNAAFEQLALSINGEMVTGETLDANEARAIYEEIVRRQRDPALVEWMGAGLLRTRIFPIQAGEERRIVVRFQAVAEREGDAVRVDYRRGTATGEPRGVRLPTRDRSRDDGDESRSESLVLRYPASGEFGSAYSPTHAIEQRTRGGMREVRVAGDGDVTLLVPVRAPRGREGSIGVVTHASPGEDAFALVTVGAPAESRRAATPRDVTFVLDVSGSMSGEKLRQAQAAGRQLLATLRASDRFRIVAFSSDVRSFDDDFVAATPSNVRDGTAWIARLQANGGTNIAGALDEALRVASPARRLPLVVFLTDGEPTVGERDPLAIAAQAKRQRGEARVYSFGVGRDVNAMLLEQLALEGRGTAQFVRPTEDVERAVGIVASRLVDPLLTDVRVRAEGFRLAQVMPAEGADLFAGQELVVLARVRAERGAGGRGAQAGRIIVEGRGPDGPVRWTREVTVGGREARDNGFVARLWAAQRVGWLSAERRRLMAARSERDARAMREIEEEIRALGERYGIPTEFTSYFVKEPGMDVATTRPFTGSGVAGGVARGVARGAVPPSAPTASPAPERAAVQFEAAKAASAQRAARSVADLAVLADSTRMVGAGGATGAGASRMAMGRAFVRDGDGTWVDARRADSSATVYRVKAYSAGYFALLRAVPGLAEAFALGDRVRVAGAGVVVEIGPDGDEQLPERALQAITRGMR